MLFPFYQNAHSLKSPISCLSVSDFTHDLYILYISLFLKVKRQGCLSYSVVGVIMLWIC